jgi:hypothetical protein
MLEPAVICPGINETCKAKLLDISKPLKPLMFNKIEDEITGNAYEPIDRVVDNLSFICTVRHSEIS